MKASLKRVMQRLARKGPRAIATFEELHAELTESFSGVHRPERFDGVLREIEADSCAIRPSVSLLGQTVETELLDGRPRFVEAGIVTSPRRKLFSLGNVCVAGEDGVVHCPDRQL